MKRIVVFTGSFNPPTKAHLAALTTAMDKISADAGYFVPVAGKYVRLKMLEKNDGIILSDNIRLSMLKAMAKTDDRIKISEFELNGGDSFRTYNTFCEIRRENPDAEIYHLCGADKLRSIPKWFNAEDFLKEFKTIAFCRNSLDAQAAIESNPLLKAYKDSFIIFDKISEDDLSEVSSTKVRKLFSENNPKCLDYLEPSAAEIFKSLSPQDFKEPELSDWVEAMKNSPKMHWKDTVYKRIYNENLKLYRDNPIAEEKMACVKVYSKELPINTDEAEQKTDIRCLNIEPIELAEEMVRAGLNPVLLSTSSRMTPGEYYCNGMSSLSENSICRQSDLLFYLYQFGNIRKKAVKESGIKICRQEYPLDINFGAIYSPEICFFRDNLKNNFNLLENPFKCAVITAAPLCFSKNDSQGEVKYKAADGGYTSEGAEIMRSKIRTVLRVALANGHSSIILNEFGTRSLALPMAETVRIFKDIFSEIEFAGKFKSIVFALPEGKRSESYNYKEKSKNAAFYKAFC